MRWSLRTASNAPAHGIGNAKIRDVNASQVGASFQQQRCVLPLGGARVSASSSSNSTPARSAVVTATATAISATANEFFQHPA